MNALTCPLSELSIGLQQRTIVSHSLLGIVLSLTDRTDKSGKIEREDFALPYHPLNFAFLLGLSTKAQWFDSDYSSYPIPIEFHDVIVDICREAPHAIWQLDTYALYTRLKILTKNCIALSYPIDRVVQALYAIHRWHSLKFTYYRSLIMQSHDFSKVPQDVYSKLDSALASLESALLAKDPLMKNHLRESHALLISYPETVVLLKPEEINTLIRAAEVHTNTEIIRASATSKTATGIAKGKRVVTTDDI